MFTILLPFVEYYLFLWIIDLTFASITSTGQYAVRFHVCVKFKICPRNSPEFHVSTGTLMSVLHDDGGIHSIQQMQRLSESTLSIFVCLVAEQLGTFTVMSHTVTWPRMTPAAALATISQCVLMVCQRYALSFTKIPNGSNEDQSIYLFTSTSISQCVLMLCQPYALSLTKILAF